MSMSRLIQPRGLKSGDNTYREIPTKVEAYTASWIEIEIRCQGRRRVGSRLIQPRGLKWMMEGLNLAKTIVEAYTASWIEIGS